MVGFAELSEKDKNKVHSAAYTALLAEKGHAPFDATTVVDATKVMAVSLGAVNFGKGGGNKAYVKCFIAWLHAHKAKDDKVMMRMRALIADPSYANTGAGAGAGAGASGGKKGGFKLGA